MSLKLFYVKGEIKMNTSGFIKGMVTGVAVGGITMLMFDPVTPRQRRKAKRQACAAIRNIGAMADDLHMSMKMKH